MVSFWDLEVFLLLMFACLCHVWSRSVYLWCRVVLYEVSWHRLVVIYFRGSFSFLTCICHGQGCRILLSSVYLNSVLFGLVVNCPCGTCFRYCSVVVRNATSSWNGCDRCSANLKAMAIGLTNCLPLCKCLDVSVICWACFHVAPISCLWGLCFTYNSSILWYLGPSCGADLWPVVFAAGTENADEARDTDLDLNKRFFLQALPTSLAAGRVKEAADEIIAVKSYIDKKAWPYVQNDLRSKAQYLGFDLKAIIDSKSKPDKKTLVALKAKLFDSINNLDYAAKLKSTPKAEKAYAETVDILKKLVASIA